MTTNVVVWCGDSITAGNHVSAGEDYPTVSAALLGALTIHNTAVGGATCDSANQAASADALYNGAMQRNLLCVMLGINDMISVSAATFVATYKTWCLARRTAGFTIAVLTMTPCNTYTNANSLRETANGLLRADSSFYDVLIDVGDTGTTMGNVAALGDTSLYSDGVHPTAAGNLLLAPVIAKALVPYLISVPSRTV